MVLPTESQDKRAMLQGSTAQVILDGGQVTLDKSCQLYHEILDLQDEIFPKWLQTNVVNYIPEFFSH